jgi:hypothetical protein
MLLGYAVLLLAACASARLLWLGAAAAWAFTTALLSAACRLGYPRCLSRQLTPNFYAVRFLSARWTVFQRRPAKQNLLPDCRALLKELIAEQTRLPAALAPGKYRTLTHDTVLRRLRQLQNAQDISAKPAYTAGMNSIRCAMTANRCKKCKEPCPFPPQGMTPRQFYLVTFEIVQPVKKTF